MCNHSVVDYGTFGLWAALLAGGRIILPSGVTITKPFIQMMYSIHLFIGYSKSPTPDELWWKTAEMENVEYMHVSDLN